MSEAAQDVSPAEMIRLQRALGEVLVQSWLRGAQRRAPDTTEPIHVVAAE